MLPACAVRRAHSHAFDRVLPARLPPHANPPTVPMCEPMCGTLLAAPRNEAAAVRESRYDR
ncbi:hypothetical protein WJ16_22145 [Burkholderia metallica]|nr:hypothetical protein WJ16_22145 [Burkholderia metallica]